MTLFMAIVVRRLHAACARWGLQNGVEKITKVMMLCLLAVLVVLAVRCAHPGRGGGGPVTST